MRALHPLTAAVLVAVAAGCRSGDRGELRELAAGVGPSLPRVALEQPLAGLSNEAVRLRAALADPPEGYVLVTPMAQSDPAYGELVLLTEPVGRRVLPIFVGGTEGMSIRLRLERRKFTRPLTHDLLDATLASLGGRIVRVQVDALRDQVYYGTLVLVRGDETIALDSRPSDAIALAIGSDAPIYLSTRVLEDAGLDLDQLDRPRERRRFEPVEL